LKHRSYDIINTREETVFVAEIGFRWHRLGAAQSDIRYYNNIIPFFFFLSKTKLSPIRLEGWKRDCAMTTYAVHRIQIYNDIIINIQTHTLQKL